MPILAKTTSVDKHAHLVYLNLEAVDQLGQPNPNGLTSIKNKHSHEIIFIDGQWIMSEVNGHTHELTEYKPSLTKQETKTDEEKVKIVHELYKNERETEQKALEASLESEKFALLNEQWDPRDKHRLNSEERASITINKTAAKIKLLGGFQRQNRTDLRFGPIEEGDDRVAKILDVVYKNIEDQNGYPAEESAVFEDQVVTGRGIFHIYVDFDKNVEGDIN